MHNTANYILESNCIFDSIHDKPFSGYVAIKDEKIISIGSLPYPTDLKDENTVVINYGNKTLMAGAVDVHCFFSGAALQEKTHNNDLIPEDNTVLLKEILGDKNYIVPFFKSHQHMLNTKGITTVKEMGFDDYYGFTQYISDMCDNDELSVRFNFMSQPVESPMNLEYASEMRDKFNSDIVKFSGFNLMTDGSVSEHCAEIKEKYNDKSTCCDLDIDWDNIEKAVILADKNGFRFSLHAQGDKAIDNCITILDKCQKNTQGKLLNRHCITDLEFSDPSDLERMGKLGVIAEIYPQIQSIAKRDDKIKMIEEKIGGSRGKYYWNRRKMIDSGVIVSCGTDLPLLIDDIPTSLMCAVYGLFLDSDIPFNEQNMMTVSEVLKAWTIGGAYNLNMDDVIGTLSSGKKADIVVFSGNLFTVSPQELKSVSVETTFFNGKIVYENN